MPNRKPLDFHNKIKFNMLNSNNTSEETIEETVKVVVQSNIDSSCVDNKIIKRSNVLRFKVYLSQLRLNKTLQQFNNNTINNNTISFEVNRYYCLIQFINPKSSEILKNQEGNSLLNKETISMMTKEEDKLCGNLNVGINKTNRGTLVRFEIIVGDRITNENTITLQSEETFLIQDRDTKKRKDKPTVSNNNGKETKKVKQQDSNDENKENLFPQLLNCKKEEMNNIFDTLDQLKVEPLQLESTDLHTFETLDDHFPYFEDDSLFDLL
ncbi:hypothetical protein ABK040_008100 [Willaertia magna]